MSGRVCLLEKKKLYILHTLHFSLAVDHAVVTQLGIHGVKGRALEALQTPGLF